MSRIDQFFREKMEERGFAFDPGYWEQAERLLAAREKRRRRKLLIWWFFGSLFLLTGVGLGSLFLFQHGERVAPSVEKESGIHAGERSPSMRPSADGPGAANVPTVDSPSIEPVVPSAPPVVPGIGPKAGTPGSEPARSYSPDVDTDPVLSLPARPGQPVAAVPEHSGPPSVPKQREQPAVLGNDEQFADTGSFISAPFPFTLEELSAIAIPQLDVEARPLPGGQFTAPDLAHIRPQKVLRWEAYTSGALYPGQGNKQAGWLGGLSVSYPLDERWRLHAGLQYRQRIGTFQALDISERWVYQFGVSIERYTLAPDKLHYVELPLGLLYTVHKHELSAGLSWNYLAGVQGSLRSTRKPESSLAYTPERQEESGWLEETGFRKHGFSILAAYHYSIWGKLKAGASLQYTPGGILSRAGQEPSVSQPLKESGPLLLGLGIKFGL